jgi:hypothetical protein
MCYSLALVTCFAALFYIVEQSAAEPVEEKIFLASFFAEAR